MLPLLRISSCSRQKFLFAQIPAVVVSPLSCGDELDLTLAQLFHNPVAPDLPSVAPDVSIATGGDDNFITLITFVFLTQFVA